MKNAAGNRTIAFFALALVALLLLLGGGGSPNPATETVLEVMAAGICLAWLWNAGGREVSARELAWPLAICGLLAMLPLAQLVPVPPSLWQSLPGRESEIGVLALIGEDASWRPLSVAPARTLASALSLGPPLLALLLVASLDLQHRQRLLVVIPAMMLAAAVLGGLQLASGGNAFHLYPESHREWVTGLHANRNAAADGFLIGGLALAAVVAGAGTGAEVGRPSSGKLSPPWVGILAGVNLVFLAATILTGSRMGILLIPLALAGQWFILAPHLSGRRMRAALLVAALGLCTTGASALYMSGNAAIARVASRFLVSRDFRPELWADTQFAIGQYWPAGSGIGTFVPVMVAVERLEVVDPTMPNRAHNDYLEYVLEGGLPGIAIALTVAAIVAWMAVRAWRDQASPRRAQIGFALFSLAVIALHSLVDYPLRSMALACIAAVATGLMMPLPRAAGTERRLFKRASASGDLTTEGAPT